LFNSKLNGRKLGFNTPLTSTGLQVAVLPWHYGMKKWVQLLKYNKSSKDLGLVNISYHIF